MQLMFAVLAGFLLDALLGDPKWLWHPVCAIGKLISVCERVLRRLFPKTARGEKTAGVLLWVIVCGLSLAVPLGILLLLGRAHPALAFAGQALMCYQILARKSLADAGAHVRKALGESLESGRGAVAQYVGRDTSALDEAGVIRAAVETIAENTTDGVVAPMLFLLIGGAPLGFFYKAVNTLDSMVGYRSETYKHFGWFSARADDACSFVPARIAAVCMIAGAGLLGMDSANALRVFRRDRMKPESPNAGQTESASAGALHVQLGGDAVYFGKPVKKPTLGDPMRTSTPADITRAADLMTAASVLALVLLGTLRLVLTGPV